MGDGRGRWVWAMGVGDGLIGDERYRSHRKRRRHSRSCRRPRPWRSFSRAVLGVHRNDKPSPKTTNPLAVEWVVVISSSTENRRRPTLSSGPSKPRQRPTLPQGCPCSTIGPEKLNFRVRDGNGCDLFGIAARKKQNEVRITARWVSSESQKTILVNL